MSGQDLLLPPSLRKRGEDHLSYFVSDLIERLDLSAITTAYEGEDRGYPPNPFGDAGEDLGVRLRVGVFFSRKVRRLRKRLLPALKGSFEQVLCLAVSWAPCASAAWRSMER